MKCSFRFRILASSLALIGIIVVLAVLKDKAEIYDPVAYVTASISALQHGETYQPAPIGAAVEDKIIVTSRLRDTNMSWVATELPDWQRAIYLVNPTGDDDSDTLVTPMNKGHEAMAYLTYIIDNYNHTIPSVVAFLHSHRDGFLRAWHVDTPLHSNVDSLRQLRLDYVKEQGYVNLRCNINPGCMPTHKKNGHVSGAVWQEIMGNSSTPVFNDVAGQPAATEGHLTEEQEEEYSKMRLEIKAACCAQFAVSKEQIYSRPWEDYYNIRQWLINTDLDDAKSGRVLEYFWHMIFGREAVHCPDQATCYCKVYGRC